MKKLSVIVVSLLLGMSWYIAAADEAVRFPHRAKFKNVAVLEIDALRQQLGDVMLIDVRSRFEFETLHIKGAMHIPLDKQKLPPAVQELRKQSTKSIVFYCNGTTCKKSYEAAQLALNAGVSNVFAYDAGLDAWTRAYPEYSVLLGRNPVAANDLIDKAKFKQRLLSAADFEARVENGSAIVLDIRDLRQRDSALFPFKEERATLDDQRRLAEIVAKAKRADKPLLVYDKVGKQTRWFQYFLEREGVKQYYFLDGGSEGYFEAKFGKINFAVPDQS